MNEEFDLDSEIKDRMREAYNRIMNSKRRFAGMTYEQGIRDAFDWLMDEGTDPSEDYR